MYGIVLWSGADGKRAVIWCEDHGDLAFYEQTGETVANPPLEAGDMVRFRSQDSRRMRRALDLERVADQRFPGVIDAVKHITERGQSGHVLRFPALSRGSCAAS